MSMLRRSGMLLIAMLAVPVLADTIVQEGSLEGKAGPPAEHLIVLDQFDTLDGTRVLDSVTLEFHTLLIAEAVTNGSGGFVEVEARLTADYGHPGETPFAETATMISDVLDNGDDPFAILYLDEDSAEIVLEDARETTRWVGDGTVELIGMAQLVFEEEPADVIDFFGGGQVTWTVTYEYHVPSACPTDLDGDGVTNGGDLGTFFAAWGRCDACEADLDGSGSVDGVDLGILFAAWGPCS
ncbi:hypothetical protein OAG01_00940 [bacterium]|nr:hypothetical protein [bacterium]